MDDALHWLVLAHLPLTDAARRALLRASRDPRHILSLSDEHWRCAGASADAIAARRDWSRAGASGRLMRDAGRDLAVLEAAAARILPLGDELYPPLLTEIYDPPPLLYVSGQPDVLLQRQFAVVGSRRCSTAAARAAGQFAAGLVDAGFAVASGLALGVDAAAHRGALEAGGHTLAVMATGIDVCYPRRHRGLLEDIRASGVVVTEFRPGSTPRRERFPMRNRVISGVSVGVLVVEASLKSGSLITAREAAEQGREVFALPHSIYDPGGRGCHRLLRDGAGLAESPADLLQDLGSLCEAHALRLPECAPPDTLRPVWRRLGFDPISVDELVAAGAGPVAEVSAALGELELGGFVERRGGLYRRKL